MDATLTKSLDTGKLSVVTPLTVENKYTQEELQALIANDNALIANTQAHIALLQSYLDYAVKNNVLVSSNALKVLPKIS